MKGQTSGIFDRAVADTPMAILDFETTGLNAGIDRVVEVSVVRIEPGQQARIVLDTLVNPNRPMAATQIHGITEQDVADAPRFEDVAADFVSALSESVIAAYNAYFDMCFLERELRRLGLSFSPPHVCLMYMRPMLGLGRRCALEDACRAHSIEHAPAHATAADALAAACLWGAYKRAMAQNRIRSFGDLAALKRYKFVESFHRDPLPASAGRHLSSAGRLKPRTVRATPVPPVPEGAIEPTVCREHAFHVYWEALKAVLCDLEVTDEEIAYLSEKREELGLTTQELRGLHARAFADMILRCVEDRSLDDTECQSLRTLHDCLSRLGWAPGD